MKNNIHIESKIRFELEPILRTFLALIFILLPINSIYNLFPISILSKSTIEYKSVLNEINYILPFIHVIEIFSGFFLLINKYVFLSLIVVFPIVLNILLYHLFLDLKGGLIGYIVFILTCLLIWIHKKSFRGFLLNIINKLLTYT